MAFKMKGSAFKLGNVATKSALKQVDAKEEMFRKQLKKHVRKTKPSSKEKSRFETQTVKEGKGKSKFETQTVKEGKGKGLEMKSPLEQNFLSNILDEGKKLGAGALAFGKELVRDQGGGYGREKTPWWNAQEAYAEKEYELLPESEKRRIEAEKSTKKGLQEIANKKKKELQDQQFDRERQQFIGKDESWQDYEARKKTPEYKQLLKDIELNKAHSMGW